MNFETFNYYMYILQLTWATWSNNTAVYLLYEIFNILINLLCHITVY